MEGGRAALGEHRDLVRACRVGVQQARAQLELEPVREGEGNEKASCQGIHSKGKAAKASVGLLLSGPGALVTAGMERAGVLNAFLVSALLGKLCLRPPSCPGLPAESGGSEHPAPSQPGLCPTPGSADSRALGSAVVWCRREATQGCPFPLHRDTETCRRTDLAKDHPTARVSHPRWKGLM